MRKISQLLLEGMLRQDISYTELEKKTSIPKSTLQRYFTEKTNKIPIDSVEKICEALDLNTPEVLGWVPSPSITPDETRLLRAWRGADESARQHALIILESSQVEPKKEQNA